MLATYNTLSVPSLVALAPRVFLTFAYLALPYPATARLLASSLLPSRGAVILACPPCGILLCALFLSALSPTPLLLHHRYALPPSAAPNLASHPSPHAAYAHTSPSARASGMLQRAHDSSSLFLDALWYDVHLSHSCRASTHIHTALQVRALPSSLPHSRYLFLHDAIAHPHRSFPLRATHHPVQLQALPWWCPHVFRLPASLGTLHLRRRCTFRRPAQWGVLHLQRRRAFRLPAHWGICLRRRCAFHLPAQ
ncbi:unnamed protein product [Closterium sp. NIES-65]|nr:unnamed protein product [Closterium sp. NIES-65]